MNSEKLDLRTLKSLKISKTERNSPKLLRDGENSLEFAINNWFVTLKPLFPTFNEGIRQSIPRSIWPVDTA